LGQARPGDYFAIQAYLHPTPDTFFELERIRTTVCSRLRIATTLGYGPRFLHSTGQLHKGGPNTGLFLQLVDEPAAAVPVPETDYTFAQLIRAQAAGDYHALAQRGRRVLRVNAGAEAVRGIQALAEALGG
jgi:transaldolase/glucose-6-phosphate isomerase